MFKKFFCLLCLACSCAAQGNDTIRAIDSPRILVDLVDGNAVVSYLNNDALKQAFCSGIVFESDKKHDAKLNCTDDRGYLTRGNTLTVHVRHKKTDEINIEFEEIERETLLSEQLSVLIKIVDAISDESRSLISAYKITDFNYVLTKKRANVKVKISQVGDAATDNQPIEYKIITGPKEHWSFSADLLVSESSQLKFDEASGSLVERDKPSEFHVGLNYHLGDTFGRKISQLDKVYIKTFITATSRPLDSYGIGIGYSFNNIGSVFVAYNWFKEDALNAEGALLSDSQTEKELRLGVSLDISSALGWLKK